MPSSQRALRLAGRDRPAVAEKTIQRAVVAHLRSHGAPRMFFFHPRNESRDQRTLAGINAGMGVVSGTPDLIIIREGLPFALDGGATGCRGRGGDSLWPRPGAAVAQ